MQLHLSWLCGKSANEALPLLRGVTAISLPGLEPSKEAVKLTFGAASPPRPLQPCAVWVITEAVLKMERNTAAISVWKYQITPVSLRMFENDPVRSSYSSPVPAQIWGWNSYCTSNTNVEVSRPLHPREEGRGPKRRGGAGLCAWDTCLPSPCSTACSSFTAKTKGTPPSSRLS